MTECKECNGEGEVADIFCGWNCGMCGSCIEDVKCDECDGTGKVESEDDDD